MRWRRRSDGVRTRSLLTRTVVSVLVALTGLLLVLGVSVDTALGSRLRGEIEQRLQDRVETAQALSGSVSDDVLVMRAGRVVEHGPTEVVFSAPQHDYTRELLAAAPRIGHLFRDPARET